MNNDTTIIHTSEPNINFIYVPHFVLENCIEQSQLDNLKQDEKHIDQLLKIAKDLDALEARLDQRDIFNYLVLNEVFDKLSSESGKLFFRNKLLVPENKWYQDHVEEYEKHKKNLMVSQKKDKEHSLLNYGLKDITRITHIYYSPYSETVYLVEGKDHHLVPIVEDFNDYYENLLVWLLTKLGQYHPFEQLAGFAQFREMLLPIRNIEVTMNYPVFTPV